jgi:hypothetical protein
VTNDRQDAGPTNDIAFPPGCQDGAQVRGTPAERKVQAVGMDVLKILPFSRHKDMETLQVYIASVKVVMGNIADLVPGK